MSIIVNQMQLQLWLKHLDQTQMIMIISNPNKR